MPFPPERPTPTFPYQVEARIGEGAMGVVYRAIEPALERRVAIKSLRAQILSGEEPAVATEYRARFLQEARAAAALSHPGAATIYRIGEEDGSPYIAMEWLEGKTLEEVMSQEGKLPPERVVPLMVDLLGTLDAAHRNGVVHRDIKPANLVLLPDGRLKVTDFGIARLRGSDLVKTQAGFVLATPRFASPEQLRGEEVDGRSDLFSAGILMFHLLTGRFPFAGTDFLQVASSVFRDEPTPLRAFEPSLSPALESVLERTLAKDREARYRTAAEMARALAEMQKAAAAATIMSAAAAATAPARAEASTILRNLPAEAPHAAAAAARSWPARDLGAQGSKSLLDRLLDRPLHAPAFAGAALLDDACLFLADGLVLAAVDTRSGETGDAVLEALPAKVRAVLHPAPEGLGPGCVRQLASLLHPPRLRHKGFDSKYVNLPGLIAALGEERFDGALRMRRESGVVAALLFCGGVPVLSLFSAGWEGIPVERPWQEWIGNVAVQADVIECRQMPCFLSFRRELRNAEVQVTRAPAPVISADGAVHPLFAEDPMARFLRWSLEEAPRFFAERERTARWKYLVEWLADVRRAALHHDLPRTGTPATDYFDLATFDAGGRVLHLAQRVSRATPEVLAAFKDDVIRAKTARLKGGDVGGAILVARSFDDATLEAYHTTELGSTGRFTFGVEESFTKYEGFVRVGPRRGFHLLLVQESDDGFTPILS
ncbi:MAG TPA: serine/threonine-protein kinase [Thermoanaerobaculia bacterium]|nr:serine/threonine-protein kinase [Thermoanaerobaculia bacterium]